MRHAKCLYLVVVFIFILTAVNAFAGTIKFKTIKVRTFKVTDIVLSFEEESTLSLTAGTNYSLPQGCKVKWRFKGNYAGYKLTSDGKNKAKLKLGEQGAEVTVEACIDNGMIVGGCKAIELKADLLKEALNGQEWAEIIPQDWNESDYMCRILANNEFQYVFFNVASKVNTVTGEYIRDDMDLSVKVPGGMLSVHRWYHGGRWVFGGTTGIS